MASTYRPGQVADLLGVSTDTVRRWCDQGVLATERNAAGHRVIPGPELARLLRERAEGHLPEGLGRASARNRLPGIVTRVERDGLTALVEVQAGPLRLVSLLTREALDELGLEPGDRAEAVVKATNVMIEVTR